MSCENASSHAFFNRKNMTNPKIKDQFSCSPHKLVERNTCTWLVSFLSFKMQPTLFYHDIWFKNYQCVAGTRTFCHITIAFNKPYS